MNEFEDKITPTEEPEEEITVSGGDGNNTALEEELENIKDMFQAELNNAMAEAEEKPTEEETDEDDESDGETEGEDDEIQPETDPADICQCCEENLRDKSLGEDYPYCAECRELMRKYPLGAKGILSLIAVIVLTVVSILYMFPKNVETLSACLTADEYLAEGKLYSGLYAYYDAISAADTDAMPKKAVARCAKAFANLNDYIDATTIAERYLSETDLKLPTYSFLKDYAIKGETLTAVENAIYDALSSDETTAEDIDEVIALIDALGAEEGAEYDKFYLEYYKYVVMHTLGASLEDQFDKLVELDKAYGEDEWVHCYDLCNLAALMGETAKAEDYFDRIIAKNTEDGSAYAYYANAFRFTETPDPDRMLQIIEEGLAAQGSYSYSTSDLYRIQALAYLLKGDTDKAMESATTMHSAVVANNYSVTNLFQSLYTYALCALVADDNEAYANVEGLLEYNGYEVPQSVIDGAKSEEALINLITDAEGELS